MNKFTNTEVLYKTCPPESGMCTRIIPVLQKILSKYKLMV